MVPLPPNTLNKLHKILDKTKLKKSLLLRVSDGTLLGLVRDEALIPHDNDVDFDVVWSKKSVDDVRSIAKSEDWRLIREVKYCGRIQQLAYHDVDGAIFDFIFWAVDERFSINFSEPHAYRVMPSKFLTELVSSDVRGFEYDVPDSLDDWLVYRYGLNWEVPQSAKGDWKLDCGDLAKAWWIK
jgi:hypothetical protein